MEYRSLMLRTRLYHVSLRLYDLNPAHGRRGDSTGVYRRTYGVPKDPESKPSILINPKFECRLATIAYLGTSLFEINVQTLSFSCS
jgi:hypothetical protein